jgi:hypothetical protein
MSLWLTITASPGTSRSVGINDWEIFMAFSLLYQYGRVIIADLGERVTPWKLASKSIAICEG